MSNIKTICFTGHRPDKIGGYNEINPVALYIKKQLTHEIMCAYDDGYRRFIFGGALGVDTWAGEIVAHIRDTTCPDMILELYSPFEGQEGNWPEESKIRYYDLMSRCDRYFEVSESGYAAWKMIVRDKAMVDASDLVIATWNGDLGKSGTGHTVTYAKKKEKPLIIIDPRRYTNG